MSSFLWLLLYLAPLLAVAAAVSGWLGWRWRGADLQKRVHELETKIAEMQSDRSAGELEHAELREKTSAAETVSSGLREELNVAQAETRRTQGEIVKERAANQALQAELARVTQEAEALREEREHATAALAVAQAEMERLRMEERPAPAPASAPAEAETAPVERTKRVRTTGVRVKTAASRQASLQDTLVALEDQISKHQATVTTLTQERNEWQQRVTQLESQSIADPAGLGLAYRSLADSEKRLQATGQEIERLRGQSAVLRRVEENAAALANVPDDDLTRIKGIKSVISEQLRAHGIRTWLQIAQWNDDELRVFSELLAFKNRATREKWKEQARALHEAAKGQLL